MKEYKDIMVYNIFEKEEEDEILDLLKADEYWKEDIENNVEDDRDYELVTNYLTNFFEDDVDKFRYKNGDEYLFCSIVGDRLGESGFRDLARKSLAEATDRHASQRRQDHLSLSASPVRRSRTAFVLIAWSM